VWFRSYVSQKIIKSPLVYLSQIYGKSQTKSLFFVLKTADEILDANKKHLMWRQKFIQKFQIGLTMALDSELFKN